MRTERKRICAERMRPEAERHGRELIGVIRAVLEKTRADESGDGEVKKREQPNKPKP